VAVRELLAGALEGLALGPSPRPFHAEDDGTRRRRRIAVAVTLAAGAALLALALGTATGGGAFVPLTVALAATWLAGAAVSGPLHLGHSSVAAGTGRDLVRPVLYAIAAFGVFVAGDLAVRQVPVLARQVREVIDRADTGPLWLLLVVALVNAAGEEVFFRGALYSAFGPHRPILFSTLAYTACTAVTGNVALVLAAASMGTLFALERRATRGILAPLVTHAVWSVLMILLLPR